MPKSINHNFGKNYYRNHMGIRNVLMAPYIEIVAFWDMTLCSLVHETLFQMNILLPCYLVI